MTVNPNKGFGSAFSYIDPKNNTFKAAPSAFNPKHVSLYYSGRHAIKFTIDSIKLKTKINTFWIPEYYCQHVAEWLKTNYANIKTYKVNPLDSNFEINGDEFLQAHDVILINNFWGVSSCKFNCNVEHVITLEDHSHGWLSDACINSNADFCIASLRKSVPVPLGGIAWQPKENKLATLDIEQSEAFDKIWDIIALAQKKKTTYENNGYSDNSLKTDFLNLFYDAEDIMHHNYNLTALKPEHKTVILDYLLTDYVVLKKENFRTLLSCLKDDLNLKIVTQDTTPFGLTCHFKHHDDMSNFKSYLIKHNIYPSLLWPDNLDKYGYFLNIHIDYRYNNLDMEYIAGIINAY